MSKWYRRMQLISTAAMLFPSAVLLMFGYMAATRPSHSATEAVVLVVLAVALPPLIYGLWAAVIWIKRGQQPGADPTSLAARIGKKPYLPFIPVAVILGLVWLPMRLSSGSGKSAGDEDVFANMRASCVSEAITSAKRGGADPGSVATKARIEGYCTCFVLQVQTQYSPAEFARIFSGGEAHLATDKKFNALLEKCAKQAGDH